MKLRRVGLKVWFYLRRIGLNTLCNAAYQSYPVAKKCTALSLWVPCFDRGK